MNITTIRNYNSKVLGYIETDDRGNKTAKDYNQRIIARYDASRNVTTDYYGKVLAQGDILAGLIYKLDN